MGRPYKDLTGQIFGLLTVIKRIKEEGKERGKWICECSCGSGIIKSYRASDLKDGHVRSCGCVGSRLSAERLKTHGLSLTKDYNTWKKIRFRCYSESCKGYKDYGGRGIKMSDIWANNAEEFIEYIKSPPHYGEPGYTIDRIDNNGNYEPGNIKYSTWDEQARNRRNNIVNEEMVLKIREMAKTLSQREIARRLNIHYTAIHYIVKNKTWKGI